MGTNQFLELIPNPPKYREPLLSRTLVRCWVRKTPVKQLPRTRKDRALIPRVVTGCHDVVEILPQEFIDGFRPLTRDINPPLRHHLDGHGVYPIRRCAGAENPKSLSPGVPEEPFGHLAPAGIMRTQKENPFF